MPEEHTIPKIFKDCCAEEGFRYAMEHPFVSGDYVAATDGRILVRMPKDKCGWLDAIPPTDKKAPPIADLAWNKPALAIVEVPAVGPVVIEKCEECKGLGQGGCPHCGSEWDCEACGGEGSYERNDRIVLAPTAIGIGERFARLLGEWGVTHLQTRTADPNEIAALYFSIGDVEGLLMPVKPLPMNAALNQPQTPQEKGEKQ